MKKVYSALRDNKKLDQVISQVRKQDHLLQEIRKMLPEELAPFLVYCIAKDPTCTLLTTSSVWASRLRFQANDI